MFSPFLQIFFYTFSAKTPEKSISQSFSLDFKEETDPPDTIMKLLVLIRQASTGLWKPTIPYFVNLAMEGRERAGWHLPYIFFGHITPLKGK